MEIFETNSRSITPAKMTCLYSVSHTKRGQKTQTRTRSRPGRRSEGLCKRRTPLWSGWTFSRRTVVANETNTLRRLPIGTPVAAARRMTALLRRDEIVRVDVLQSNEHPRDAGPLRLRDEVFDFVAKGVDLDH